MFMKNTDEEVSNEKQKNKTVWFQESTFLSIHYNRRWKK